MYHHDSDPRLSTRSGWSSTTAARHLGIRGARAIFDFVDFITFLHIFFSFKETTPSTQIHNYSDRDSNSVSSSTDNMTRLGSTPSYWRIPAPRVDLRRAAVSSSEENTSQSVKPAALNSLELTIIATGICEESTFSVGSHSRSPTWDSMHPHPHGSTTAWPRGHTRHRRSVYPCNPPTCGVAA